MATMRIVGLTALVLSGGLISWAGAQPMPTGAPAYQMLQLQEPPPLPGSSRPGVSPGRAVQFSQPEVEQTMDMDMDMDSGPGWSPPSGIQVREDRGIRYVSGGIGVNERDELNALSHQFNLRLLFAVQAGNYLADIRVNITNARGQTVLSAKSEGPWFFVQLPPGAYTVDVDAMGRTQGQSVRINSGRQSRLNFFWR